MLKMETTIKHAEEERIKAADSARNLYEEMQILKEDVDTLRCNVGLERLPDSEANNKIVQKYVITTLVSKNFLQLFFKDFFMQ